nr:MAG TPA: hypothetical protein [Caudoviricetes sp.]
MKAFRRSCLSGHIGVLMRKTVLFFVDCGFLKKIFEIKVTIF